MPSRLTADDVIALLGLEPLQQEGGFFRETWRGEEIPDGILAHLPGPNHHGSAIYYLMTPDHFSAMHRLPTDEVFHHYLGDTVEQLLLFPDGAGAIQRIGGDLLAGDRPQAIAPAGAWQGSRLAPGGAHGFALLGTTMAPGFAYRHYEHGDRSALEAAWPEWATMIRQLTREPGNDA